MRLLWATPTFKPSELSPLKEMEDMLLVLWLRPNTAVSVLSTLVILLIMLLLPA